ncbi:helix-hairpin-helix domain-containing protein [Streptomyces sp. TS71-3]|uniref:helix-hairpin-helix domain-containing protein n=1 Tax=Streptomyces sp. TS71-3 TaxID=2733862 RepID=UPI001B2D3C9C|nr:helix-hairpin-helix domain-containing protein [Streptomyces sp. TS71-3]GHJ38716.1 hypothetical protein Sm713_43250 [Streptomyces sp. TS71-3]
MSTEPAESRAEQQDAETDGPVPDGAETGSATGGDAGPADRGEPAEGGAEGAGATELSEAEAELAAQREERRRIEERKAARQQPVASGSRLSGTAAELLAAVRAVEGGAAPARSVFGAEPAPRSAPEPAPAERSARVTLPSAPVSSAEAVKAAGEVLAAGGAPASLAGPAATALGEDAADVLRDDPWQLLRLPGVRPEQADGFARALLGPECGPEDERRGRALTVWLLDQAALAGHTVLEAPALSGALGRYSVPDPDEAVQSAVAEGDVLVFQDALDTPAGHPGSVPAQGGPGGPGAPRAADGAPEAEDGADAAPVRVLIGLERYALAEESLADGLARLVTSAPQQAADPAAWEAAAPSAPGSAAELLRATAGNSLVLHSGGEASRAEPAALVAAAGALGLRVCAAAHTADGRRRFAALAAAAGGGSEGSGPAASTGPSADGGTATAPEDAGNPAAPPAGAVVTVHGLLTGEEGPGRDAEGALAMDLLVVLDAPQLDVETAAILVESLPDGARLVLSGDPAVLWSAGPGRVFGDLVAARPCPCVASRIPDPGPIGELVSGIGAGELQQVEAPGREVVVVPVRDAGEAVHRTVQLVADSVPRTFGVTAEQTQVIAPGHGGAAGTRALNAALKERLNPGPGRFAGFDPGDRVAYAPAAGRTLPGRVVKADAEGLHLDCDGSPVVVPKERVEQSVRHGWALTAHQAVGLRRPAAVVVLPGDAAQSLTRSWVYTAFSRGERHLSVVQGADDALPRAVAEIPSKPRTTRLPTLLKTQLTGGARQD